MNLRRLLLAVAVGLAVATTGAVASTSGGGPGGAPEAVTSPGRYHDSGEHTWNPPARTPTTSPTPSVTP